jgi:hypothetical protein
MPRRVAETPSAVRAWRGRVCPLARIGYSSERTPVPAAGSGRAGSFCGRSAVVAHHLAKVRVAGSNPVVRSRCRKPSSEPTDRTALRYRTGSLGGRLVAEWPSGLGKGLQSPVRGFDSRFRLGRLAQRESASLTRKRSLVQSQYRPPVQRDIFERLLITWANKKEPD